MTKIEGIQDFIEYKNSVEKERPQLTVEPRLITIDGIDGSGKSTIARKVFEELKERLGEGRVALVDVTNLKGSIKQEHLHRIVKSQTLSNEQLDKIYVAGVNRAYEEQIIPALKAGKLVVVDRSEVDLLRYALEIGNEKAIEKRSQYIQEGTPTHRLWAGSRIFIEIDPESAWENLMSRGNLSPYDPQNFEAVKERLVAEEQAEKTIQAMPCLGEIRIIRKTNRRIHEPQKREIYLTHMAKEIGDSLKLP